MRAWFIALLVAILLSLSSCATTPPPGIQPVTPFALNRYLGKWYEQARLDHSFERGMTHVSAEYRLNDDGSVQVINLGYNPDKKAWKKAIGHAQFVGAFDQAALKVSFFGPFYGGYFVAALDKDYQWALVVGPSREYFWILTRERMLTAHLKADLLERTKALGIDPKQLIWVDQSAPTP